MWNFLVGFCLGCVACSTVLYWPSYRRRFETRGEMEVRVEKEINERWSKPHMLRYELFRVNDYDMPSFLKLPPEYWRHGTRYRVETYSEESVNEETQEP